MFFGAAKIFWLIFQPSNFAALSAFAGLLLIFWRKQRIRRAGFAFLIISAVTLIIFGALPTSHYLLAPLEDRFQRPDYVTAENTAGMIILGGTERPGLSLSRQFPGLGFDAARLAGAAAIIHQLPHKPVIFTGGIREPGGFTQADVAGDYLASIGVDKDRLRLERGARNTAENATLTYAMLTPEARRQQWLVITSAFHMPRAVGAFRAAGFDVVPYPVAYQTSGAGASAWTFDVAESLRLSDLAVHEWIGLIVYSVTGRSNELFPTP